MYIIKYSDVPLWLMDSELYLNSKDKEYLYVEHFKEDDSVFSFDDFICLKLTIDCWCFNSYPIVYLSNILFNYEKIIAGLENYRLTNTLDNHFLESLKDRSFLIKHLHDFRKCKSESVEQSITLKDFKTTCFNFCFLKNEIGLPILMFGHVVIKLHTKLLKDLVTVLKNDLEEKNFLSYKEHCIRIIHEDRKFYIEFFTDSIWDNKFKTVTLTSWNRNLFISMLESFIKQLK